MSAKASQLPFAIGATLFNGTTTIGVTPSTTSIDTSLAQYVQDVASVAGRIFEVEDVQWDSTARAKPMRSSTLRLVMAVVNGSGAFLLPKRLVGLKVTTAGTDSITTVKGYTDVHDPGAFPVDEFLPATGVAPNDVFWVTIEGPAMCLTGLSADATNVITAGQVLAAFTGSTTGATTSGRVYSLTTAATTNTGDALLNRIGRAMSARTTANTGNDVLVNILRH